MTEATVIWLTIGAVSAALYFGIAGAVSIYGIKDLRKLLGKAGQAKKQPDPS